MNLSPAAEMELAKFPPAMRALVERELAVGNSILEIGHTWPAPPVGAYVKLAKKVSTRPRISGSGLDFYERNSSSHSGEFTDSERFFFVLERPNPPPPEPDMDAIRKAMEPKANSLDRLAERLPASVSESNPSAIMSRAGRPSAQRAASEASTPPSAKRSGGPKLPAGAVLQSSTRTGAAWLLHFRDSRPPQEIEFELERSLMILLPLHMDGGKLIAHGTVKITGVPFSILLTYEAALSRANCYSLRVEASWADSPEMYWDYFCKSSSGWFEFWTRDFQRASPPAPDEGSAARYQNVCQAALDAENHLKSVGAIQQEIISALKAGASFSTAHKEGGTIISWQNPRFVRTDYGDYPDRKEFVHDSEFLAFLRQFYDSETSRNIYPAKPSDFEAWKLILRLLRTR